VVGDSQLEEQAEPEPTHGNPIMPAANNALGAEPKACPYPRLYGAIGCP